MLTVYDDYDSIEYDAIGNPTIIGFNDSGDWYSGYELTWQGRQLMSYIPFDNISGYTDGMPAVSHVQRRRHPNEQDGNATVETDSYLTCFVMNLNF